MFIIDTFNVKKKNTANIFLNLLYIIERSPTYKNKCNAY